MMLKRGWGTSGLTQSDISIFVMAPKTGQKDRCESSKHFFPLTSVIWSKISLFALLHRGFSSFFIRTDPTRFENGNIHIWSAFPKATHLRHLRHLLTKLLPHPQLCFHYYSKLDRTGQNGHQNVFSESFCDGLLFEILSTAQPDSDVCCYFHS